jgi:hypothetical protein
MPTKEDVIREIQNGKSLSMKEFSYFLNDKDVVKVAVQKNGSALRYASAELTADKR